MADTNDWYYNSNTGVVTQMVDAQARLVLHAGIGWHGHFANRDAAIQFYNDGKAQNPGWKAPISDTNLIQEGKNLIGSVTEKASSAASGAVDAAKDPLGFKEKLADLENWFIRGAEIVLGLVLLGIGLSALTGKSNIISDALKAGTSAKTLASLFK